MGSAAKPLRDQALAVADGDDLLALEGEQEEPPHLLPRPARALAREGLELPFELLEHLTHGRDPTPTGRGRRRRRPPVRSIG